MTTDLVEKCARALWQRERERAAHCDDVLSSIRGQAIKPTMDPFDEHRDMWVGDALAVIDALADGVSDEMMDIAAKTLLVDPSRLSPGGVDELRRALSAAIRAAKSREG